MIRTRRWLDRWLEGDDQVLDDSLEHTSERFGVRINTIHRLDASRSARV